MRAFGIVAGATVPKGEIFCYNLSPKISAHSYRLLLHQAADVWNLLIPVLYPLHGLLISHPVIGSSLQAQA